MKTLIVTLALTVSPGLALAQCFGDHAAKDETAMTCAPGTVFDETAKNCVPTTG